MMHEAILFDMDGVIVDTYHSVTALWRQLAREHGVHLTQEDFVQRVYGRTSEHTLVSLFPHLTEQQRQAILAEIDAGESIERYQEVPGVTTVMRLLKSYGMPTALVTSGTKATVAAGALCIGIQSPYNAVPLLEAGAQAVVPDFMAIRFEVVSPGELALLLQGNLAVKVSLTKHE